MDVSAISQVIISGILLGAVYGLIAVGLTLIWGMMDVVNFAHGDFVMLGMYVAFVTFTSVGVGPALFLPVSGAVLFLIGVIAYYALIRRLMRGSILAQIIGTFGLSLFIHYAIFMIFSPNFKTLPRGLLGGSLQVADVSIVLPKLFAGVASIILATGIYWLLTRTRIGSQMLAVAENREGAMLMGIEPDRVQALTWGVSAASAGFAGGFLATFYYISPGVGIVFVLLAFVVVSLGGFGSVPGAIVAGLIIGVVQVLAGYLLGSNYGQMVVFGLFLAVLWVRPQGLFGRAT